MGPAATHLQFLRGHTTAACIYLETLTFLLLASNVNDHTGFVEPGSIPQNDVGNGCHSRGHQRVWAKTSSNHYAFNWQ